jgi:undecaprenyl-diphosphatase
MSNASTSRAYRAPRLPLPLTIGAFALLALALALTIPTNPNWWQIVLLGVVQGSTEWLPISSTAHLLLVGDLIGFTDGIGGTFEIFIQIGTVLAVVAFYLCDLLDQARALLGQATPAETRAARRLWASILAAMVPAILIGLAARDFVKAVLFESPPTIAAGLIIGGLILLAVERWLKRPPRTTEPGRMHMRQALVVGFAQVLALIPGVSRSGSSIVGGLLAGLDRRTATAFSFYLAIPTLGGATLVDLLGSLDQIGPGDWNNLFLGAVVAMIVGYLTIGWLLRYIARNTFVAFGIYRIVAGLIILALVALGRL